MLLRSSVFTFRPINECDESEREKEREKWIMAAANVKQKWIINAASTFIFIANLFTYNESGKKESEKNGDGGIKTHTTQSKLTRFFNLFRSVSIDTLNLNVRSHQNEILRHRVCHLFEL